MDRFQGPRSFANRVLKKRKSGSSKADRDKSRKYRRETSANIYDAVDFLRSKAVVEEHERTVARIRNRLGSDPGAKLRVAFVVSSPSRWNSQSIVRHLQAHPRVECDAILRPSEYSLPLSERVSQLQGALEFYESTGLPVEASMDLSSGSVNPIEDSERDVYFLEMPWGMKDYPERLTGIGLPIYMHYGFMMMANHGMHYNIGSFHSYLWKYFAQTEEHRRLHLDHDPNAHSRIVVSGYPKLDVYMESPQSADNEAVPRIGEGPGKGFVIYAPHHSLGKPTLGMSTFDWSGQVALDLARANPSILWAYKPHPSLQHNAVQSGFMGADEYRMYVEAWDNLPNAHVAPDSDYFGLFKNSRALITCSGSFLAEYLPTGSPIVWLKSPKTVGLNRIGEAFASGYYVAKSPDDLRDLFNGVIIREDDPLRETREGHAASLFPRGVKAGEHIARYLINELVPDGFG